MALAEARDRPGPRLLRGGGTDFALCSDLIVCAEDCRIGYPPARVWGSPTTAMWMYRLGLERSKRLLLTGDALDGRRAVEWGLACEACPRRELEAAGLALARRVALLPGNQAAMMKLLVNQAFEQMGLHTTQLIGTLLDGAARHTPEGTAFTQRGLADVRGAVAERDAPFGDYGQGPATVVARGPRAAPSGSCSRAARGRRIGGDKAIVELEGRPLLLYPLAVLRAVFDEVAVVAKRATVLPPVDAGVAIWLEADEPRHPLAGVVQALRCARGRPVVVVAGDMPFVTRGLVAALARERSRGARGRGAATRAGRLQPLCARYDPRALSALAACDFSAPVRDVVAALGPRIVEWPDDEPFFNVNHPEDILQAAALLSGR